MPQSLNAMRRFGAAKATKYKPYSEGDRSLATTVTPAADMIVESLNSNGFIYLCGNGGSAADAQHIAGEFVGRFKLSRQALPAIALSTNTSVLTCIGNDYNFENIFERQLEAFIKQNDILWVLSTSGLSTNIINAAKVARKKMAKIIAFIGKSGSELENIADLCIYVNSSVASSIQEIHQIAYHIICDLVESKILKKVK